MVLVSFTDSVRQAILLELLLKRLTLTGNSLACH